MNPFLKIKQKLDGGKEFTEDKMVQAHHIFMRKYGWIPLKEFKNLPIPTFWGLYMQIGKEIEERMKAQKKGKR